MDAFCDLKISKKLGVIHVYNYVLKILNAEHDKDDKGWRCWKTGTFFDVSWATEDFQSTKECEGLRLVGLMTIGAPDYSGCRTEDFETLKRCRAEAGVFIVPYRNNIEILKVYIYDIYI